jgi:hypothetical protein
VRFRFTDARGRETAPACFAKCIIPLIKRGGWQTWRFAVNRAARR